MTALSHVVYKPLKRLLLILLLSIGVAPNISSQEFWFQLNSPTSRHLRTLYFHDSSTGWAAGDSGTIIHTTNGGQDWIIQDSNTESEIIDIFFLTEHLGWGLTWTTQDPFRTVILTTTDGGTNWTSTIYPEDYVLMNAIFFIDSLNGWMVGFGGAPVSTTNGGSDWIRARVSGLCAGVQMLDLSFYGSGRGFANGGAFDQVGVIWELAESGDEWVAACVSPEPIQQLCIIDSLTIIGVGGDFEFGTGVIRTTNGGSSWEYRSLEVFGIATAISFRTGSEGWAPLGLAQRFIYTVNSGITWNVLRTPNSTTVFDVMFTDSLNGYAVGYDGVILKYQSPLVNVSEKFIEHSLPRTQLFKNYPDPFNPSTNISFGVPVSGFVSLRVFNLLGQEVATLISEERAAGLHSVQWDAGGVAGGVYFYRLVTNDAVETRKMMVFK